MLTIRNYIIRNFVKYPITKNFNYMWTFGSVILVFWALQVISGLVLACHYTPTKLQALNSIIFILKDVQYGWLAYRTHVLGSSFIFIALLLHIYRNVYYKLFFWENRYSWWSGYILYLLTMLLSFIGYVLPWGQMSYWAATVIINTTTIIPFIGNWLPTFLWGGNSVSNCTLQRFFIVHIVLALVITAFIAIHIHVIHNNKSTNLIKKNQIPDVVFIDIYPQGYIKDALMIVFFLILICIFLIVAPDFFSNRTNWVPADPQVTPLHVQPEWYLLPYYGIIKFIPNKVLGIITVGSLILIPFILPTLTFTNVQQVVSAQKSINYSRTFKAISRTLLNKITSFFKKYSKKKFF